jgi:hypothetical protein
MLELSKNLFFSGKTLQITDIVDKLRAQGEAVEPWRHWPVRP